MVNCYVKERKKEKVGGIFYLMLTAEDDRETNINVAGHHREKKSECA